MPFSWNVGFRFCLSVLVLAMSRVNHCMHVDSLLPLHLIYPGSLLLRETSSPRKLEESKMASSSDPFDDNVVPWSQYFPVKLFGSSLAHRNALDSHHFSDKATEQRYTILMAANKSLSGFR